MTGLHDLPPPTTRTGLDIVDVERFRDLLARRPRVADRLFTAAERARCARAVDPVPHLAARFAVKEALRKALGRAVAWHECEVVNEPGGAPRLRVPEGLSTRDGRSVRAASVSITHDAGVAAAVVAIEVDRA